MRPRAALAAALIAVAALAGAKFLLPAPADDAPAGAETEALAPSAPAAPRAPRTLPLATLPATARGADETALDLESLLASDEGAAILSAADVGELLDSTHDRARLLARGAAIARGASACIRAGGCRDARDPARAYYDPTHGHTYRALSNSLKLLQAAATEGDRLPALPAAELIANLEIPSGDIQLTSLELVLGSSQGQGQDPPLDPNTWRAILGEADQVQGPAKAMYFSLLESAAPTPARAAVMRTLERSLAGDDASTVLEVLRGFDRIRLTEGEFRRAERALCPLIRMDDPSGNSRAARAYLERYASSRGYNSAGCQG